MEALAARLAHLDPAAGDGVRVVMFYDTLMRRRVDLPALVRASAGLAGCVAGIRIHGTGRTIRVAADGQDATGAACPPPSATPVTLDDEEIGTVWLERPGSPAALDQLLLDRFAIAASAVFERYGPARTTMADPALVELVISSTADEAARARALRLLGFAVDVPVQAVAVRSCRPLDELGRLVCPSRLVKAARLGDVGVVLATSVDVEGVPADVRAGVGTAGAPDESWCRARTALRFATTRQPVVHYDELGALALVADLDRDTLRGNADVAAVARLADLPEALDTLEAYCATGSRRAAADLLHLHHSSVARRLDQLGKILGIELTEPGGLVRVTLALAAWRLLQD
ncbi:helix-turn-helix domain-containing protein [Saccharomonospora azurea]|uniref:helix-turn-helix domain-containing protein n=1 Tax=Saccharomonospora azurea TaxID=40988 RepID=UPI003D9305F9